VTQTASGWAVALDGQLERADYEQVNPVLERIGGGGRWQRAKRAHLFDCDPRPELAAVVAARMLPPDPKRRDGWFATPAGLAEDLDYNYGLVQLDQLANDEVRALEPSAGDGALADALRRYGVPADQITCVEPDPYRAEVLRAKGYPVFETRFQQWATTASPEAFDLVLMNPPFVEPDDRLTYISHVDLAWRMVDNGGRLIAIVPNSLAFRTDRRTRALRALVERYGEWEDVPAGAFQASGTGVRALTVVMDRPLTAPLDPPPLVLAEARTGASRQLGLFDEPTTPEEG
jgi:hypothetical protein